VTACLPSRLSGDCIFYHFFGFAIIVSVLQFLSNPPLST